MLAEESRLAEERRFAEERRLMKETRVVEESRVAEGSRLAEETRVEGRGRASAAGRCPGELQVVAWVQVRCRWLRRAKSWRAAGTLEHREEGGAVPRQQDRLEGRGRRSWPGRDAGG